MDLLTHSNIQTRSYISFNISIFITILNKSKATCKSITILSGTAALFLFKKADEIYSYKHKTGYLCLGV